MSIMSEAEQTELLFFDTFSHDSIEDLNLDLVQLPRPVLINEVRVIPLGRRVQADVPGGVRLGATNPSSFKLEFFVNNLTKPNAAVFEKLGVLEYKANDCIQLISEAKVATDGLIIKGWYNTITLAVYGSLTTVEREKAASPPPPPPPLARSRPQAVLPIGIDSHKIQPEFGVPLVGPTVSVPPMAPILGETSSEWHSPGGSYPHAPPPLPQSTQEGSPSEEGYFDSEQGPRSPQDIPLDSQGGAHDPRAMSRSEQRPDYPPRAYDGDSDRDSIDRRAQDRSRSVSQERETRGYESRLLDRDYHGEGSREPRDVHRDHSKDHDSDKDRSRSWGRDEYREYRDKDRGRDSDWEVRSRDRGHSDREGEHFIERGRECEGVARAKDSDSVSQRSWPRSPAPERKSPSSIRSRSPSMSQGSHGKLEDLNLLLPEPDTEPGEIPEVESPDDMYGLVDNQSVDGEMDKMYQGLSDGEIQDPDGGGYSEISSDEDNLLMEEDTLPKFDWESYEPPEGIDDSWVYSIASFNPYQCDLVPLETIADPSMTPYEVEKQRILVIRDEDLPIPEEAKQIMNIIETYKDSNHHGAWIEAMETIPSLIVKGLVYLVNKTDSKEVLDLLVAWTFEGLDLDMAIAQPETAYKVRHIKMGIRVASALCQCDSFIAFRMLSKEVQHKLIDLYTSAYMSSSVKLQIIRALDATTRLKEGSDWLLGRHHLQVDSDMDSQEEPMSSLTTAYPRLLKVMLVKQPVRAMVALSAFLRKVSVYENLSKLSQTVELVVKAAAIVQKPSPSEEEASMETPLETDVPEVEPEFDLGDEEADTILTCIEEIIKVIKNADALIGQPKRTLPNQVKFSEAPKPHDPYPNLFHMFNACGLLESLYALLSGPSTSNHGTIFLAVRELLTQLLRTMPGLLYLSAKTDTVNGILRTLTQNHAPEYNADEGGEEPRAQDHPAHQLGLLMVYHLQALQHIDQLLEYHQKDGVKNFDDAEVLGVLHSLYSMTFSPAGKEAVVTVMVMDTNIKSLLPFLTVAGDDETEARLKKTVCFSYALFLVLMVVRNSNNIEYLEKYGSTLRSISEQEMHSVKMAERMLELSEWLLPLKTVSVFNEESLPALVSCIKQFNDEIRDLPKGLVTVMRILRHLAIAPPRDDVNIEELRYKYVLIELYREDCLPVFYNMINKIGDVMLRPWQQGFPQGEHQMTIILGAVRPMLAINKAIHSYLIEARGGKFRDLSSVPSLLHLHTVLCSVSTTGVLTPEFQQIQNDIVDVLMTFTQPALLDESDETLSQSLWTLCMKEILKYVMTAPYTFLSGLILVSEMLPLPLPIQTREGLSDEEVAMAINNRKLWSAHLHPLSDQIQQVISSLAGSCCHPLQQLLRRVCWQLADLAAPTALTLVRCLLDTLTDSMDASQPDLHTPPPDPSQPTPDVPEDPPKPEVASSSHTSRVLNLIAFLMNQAPIKAAFLQLCKGGNKQDEKYSVVLERLVGLLNVVSERSSHTQAQESIVSIFQSLCDLEVTLLTGDNSNLTFNEQLSNSLPPSEQLSQICVGLLQHIDHRDHKFSSVLPSLRTLTLLMDHDYGFYRVKSAMEKVSTAFFNLFMLINATFSKDSSDCIATLSSAAECIQFLVALPEQPEGMEQTVIDRTYTMSFGEVKDILKWNPKGGHPLDDLNMLLQEYAKEEETLKAVYESVNSVVSILRSADQQKPIKEMVEPVLPPAESVSTQFGMRLVFLITEDDDDRLSAPYWLSTPMVDDSDQETELARCDLEELASKLCPDLDLKADLEKATLPSDMVAQPKPKRRRSTLRRHDTINTSKMRGSNRGFVAPMRGRGFGRGSSNPNRQDSFRSRPPNTSRPPSMHVDDFVKMENQGPPAASNPANMNQHNRGRMEKETPGPPERGRGGGRGFDRGRRTGGFQGRGGQFFSPPGNYGGGGRRDQGATRGGYGNQRASLGGRGGPGPRGGMGRGNATSRGNQGSHGNASKSASPWANRSSPRQGYMPNRNFPRPGDRGDSMERDRRRDSDGGGRGGRFGGRGGRGNYFGGSKARDMDSRFMPPPGGGGGGYGRRERARHQRSFTK